MTDWLNAGGLVHARIWIRQHWLGIVAVAFLGACVLYATGCGASQAAQHRRLNAVTLVADPTYAQAVDLCDVLRDEIVSREGTSYAEDRSDMDDVHEVCDLVVAGFEALRASQLTARGAIDSGLGGASAGAISAALELWPNVLALVERLRARYGDR